MHAKVAVKKSIPTLIPTTSGNTPVGGILENFTDRNNTLFIAHQKVRNKTL